MTALYSRIGIVALAALPAALTACFALKSGSDRAPLATDAAAIPDLYVDQTSTNVACDGSAGCPFASITAGLAAVGALGATLHVAPGTYDEEHGERFPLAIRSGVHLVGSGPSETFLVGHGAYEPLRVSAGDLPNDTPDFGLPDSGTFGATVVLGDAHGATSIEGVAIVPPKTSTTDHAIAIACDRGNATRSEARAPSSVISGVMIDGVETGVLVTPSADSSCNLAIVGSTLRFGRVGVRAYGCGAMESTGAVSLSIGGAEGERNAFSGFRRDTLHGTAIELGSCVSHSKIVGNLFSGSDIQIWSRRYSDEREPQDAFDVVGNTFDNARNASIHLWGSSTIRSLKGNTFRGSASPEDWNAAGLVLDSDHGPRDPSVLKARENEFVGNEIGIYVRHRPASGNWTTPSDFGTQLDPGKNVIRCNSSSGIAGSDFLFDNNDGRGSTISMVGNVWDHIPLTTDAGANGSDIVVRPSRKAKADAGITIEALLDLSHGTASTDPCPGDHVR